MLENPWNQAPEEAFGITKSPEEAPDCAEYIDITFQNGKPIAINNQEMTLADLILSLNELQENMVLDALIMLKIV